jgi:hypothetical protein
VILCLHIKIGRNLTSILKSHSLTGPDQGMFRFMTIFTSCFTIGQSCESGIFTKCGARTQAITSSDAPIFGMPPAWEKFCQKCDWPSCILVDLLNISYNSHHLSDNMF